MAGKPMRDPILHRAAQLAAKRPHAQRQLVCLACLRDADFLFGGVHSDRRCGRCGREPMGAGAVVGPDAWAGGVRIG